MNKEVVLADNIVIPCPMFSFGLRRVSMCLQCDHYQGLAQATVDGVPIDGDAEAYQVICGKPITRRLQKIIED